MMKKQSVPKIIQINRKRFCEWYFDESTSSCISEDCIDSLIKKGKFEITLKELLNNLGYIPMDCIVNREEIDPSDIDNDITLEDPDYTKYKFVFWRNKNGQKKERQNHKGVR